jgi:hypothetical protein
MLIHYAGYIYYISGILRNRRRIITNHSIQFQMEKIQKHDRACT